MSFGPMNKSYFESLMVKPIPILERLMKKVETNQQSGCWEWTGTKVKTGYGHIRLGGKCFRAHRVMYALIHDNVPNDKHVLHKCDNTKYVNPDHLFCGTHADNMLDMNRKGRGVIPIGEQNGNSKLTNSSVR